MNLEEQKFEDREGSDFEERKGSNLKKIIAQKEKMQQKKLGIKPTDTSIDQSNIVVRELLGKVLSEQPKQELSGQAAQVEDDPEEDQEEEKDNKTFDHKEELRIKMMQFLNPRIIKSKEAKNYMSREDIKEEVYAILNQLATHKLDLYKKAIAINAPVELNERNKANREKSKNIARQIGANAFISRKVNTMQSPLIAGREVMSNPKISSKQISDLYNKLPNPLGKSPATIVADRSKLTPDQQAEAERRAAHLQNQAMASDAKALRQAHYGLHEEVTELDPEPLSEANRNPNIIRQGRTKIIKARVRGGKVQRRKKFSAVKGYTIRGGKLKRMSVQERLRRKRAQRRAKVKRKAKQARALMRRKRSLRKRASLGLKE